MRIGVAIEETWAFFHEIYAELKAHHQVRQFERTQISAPIFTERLNRRRFHQHLQSFLQENDVVFFEWSSELLAIASHLPKTGKIVTRLHRYEMYRWADHINWDHVDCLILVSEAKRREFLNKYPAPNTKVVVIPEAISLARFQPSDKTFQGDIGTLCNLIPRKRVYELILVFYELIKTHPHLRLHIGGGKSPNFLEYPDNLYALVRRLGIQDKVIFYGKVTNPEEWYQNIDIFVSNSYSEGLQVALLESMASGVFSLSHAWEGADEILPAENLFYTDVELVAQISRYLECTKDERSHLNNTMRPRVMEKCDIVQVKEHIRLLIEYIGSRNPVREKNKSHL